MSHIRQLRTLARWVGLAVLAAVVIALLLPTERTEVVDPVPESERDGSNQAPAIGPATVVMRRSIVDIFGATVQRFEETEWYMAGGLYRRERVPLPGMAGTPSTLVADGLHLWSEHDGTVAVEQLRTDGETYAPDWVEEAEHRQLWYVGRDRCRTSETRNMETVAGRMAHVIAVGPDRCEAKDDVNRMLWVNTETFIPLRELRTDAVTSAMVYRREVQELTVSEPFDLSVFAYKPPKEATVVDHRVDRGPSDTVFRIMLDKHSRKIGQKLFLPNMAELDYVPQWPQLAKESATIVFVPAVDAGPPTWPLERGLVMVQHPAGEPLHTDLISIISIGLSDCDRGARLDVTIERTAVTLCSPNLAEEVLQQLADTMVSTSGDEARFLVQAWGPMLAGLAEAANAVDYPLLVPTQIPEGLVMRTQVPSEDNPYVRLLYQRTDGAIDLTVVMGPAGSGLDAAPSGLSSVHTVRGMHDAYLVHRPTAEGGPILWWVEDKTYVALHGDNVEWVMLLSIAESMVPVSEVIGGD